MNLHILGYIPVIPSQFGVLLVLNGPIEVYVVFIDGGVIYSAISGTLTTNSFFFFDSVILFCILNFHGNCNMWQFVGKRMYKLNYDYLEEHYFYMCHSNMSIVNIKF